MASSNPMRAVGGAACIGTQGCRDARDSRLILPRLVQQKSAEQTSPFLQVETKSHSLCYHILPGLAFWLIGHLSWGIQPPKTPPPHLAKITGGISKFWVDFTSALIHPPPPTLLTPLCPGDIWFRPRGLSVAQQVGGTVPESVWFEHHDQQSHHISVRPLQQSH